MIFRAVKYPVKDFRGFRSKDNETLFRGFCAAHFGGCWLNMVSIIGFRGFHTSVDFGDSELL